MAKMSWDSFVAAHSTGICVVTNIASVKIRSGTLAKDGRKLPTAYGMLLEALQVILKGSWTARKVKSGVQIVLADAADLATLNKAFRLGQVNSPAVSAPCSKVYQFVFGFDEYRRLATSLRYA